MTLPALFLSHGAPTLAVEETRQTRAWAKLARELPRPKAILAVSAHWDTPELEVSAAPHPETIHDFGGFPKELYEQRYPAPGAPVLAKRIAQHLQQAGIQCRTEPERGLDHGAWVPLKWMYPEADTPVTQLSVQSSRGPRHHYAVGRALAPLRNEGVLILASGGIVHNLREIEWQSKTPRDWAVSFNDWMAARVEEGSIEALLDYRSLAPSAARSHPTDEHLEPFFVALGAGGAPARRLQLGMEMGTLGMDGYVFG
ncbi:MAG: 4,5-DOPA dioxygenase extradiol [Usitatibacter sp.]